MRSERAGHSRRIPRLQGTSSRRNGTIPIIFMTSFPDDAVRAQAMALGAIEFLHIPFSEDKILNAVQKALHR